MENEVNENNENETQISVKLKLYSVLCKKAQILFTLYFSQ